MNLSKNHFNSAILSQPEGRGHAATHARAFHPKPAGHGTKTRAWRWGIILAAGVLGLGILGGDLAQGADAASLARDANTALRTAQGNLFNGKLSEAAESLRKAEDLIRDLKAADSAHAQVSSLEQRSAKLKKDIESRQPKAKDTVGPSATAAASAATAGKLPGGASYRLREADRSLTEAERAIASPTASAQWRMQSAKAGIKTAQEKLEEIQAQFGDQAPASHPDIRAVTDRIAALEKQISSAAEGAAAAQQAGDAAKSESAKWEARLAPYVLGPGRQGHDKDKWMRSSAPRALDELARAINLQREAGAALAEYDKAGLTAPGDTLAEYARQLRYALESFAKSHQSFVEESVASAGELLEQQDRFLKTQEAKPPGGKEPLLTLQKDQLSESRAKINLAAALAPASDGRIEGMRKRLTDIERRDEAIRKARVASTRLTADRYSGQDLKQLKSKAEAIVMVAIPAAKILRVTIIRPDWKEESVIEPTDTTRTALRFRTTRSVTAQVAARAGAEVKLHTLDISKDRQSDGSWGALYGHIMFTDPILEENVMK